MTEARRQKTVGQRKQTARRTKPRVRVCCAFCHGKGRDPFDIMSPLATCQVCGGTGWVALHPPIVPCAFCRGTGISPGLRMTCTTCGGVGMIEVPDNTLTCPCCGGTGRASDSHWPDSPLSCSRCRGKGVVTAQE